MTAHSTELLQALLLKMAHSTSYFGLKPLEGLLSIPHEGNPLLLNCYGKSCKTSLSPLIKLAYQGYVPLVVIT